MRFHWQNLQSHATRRSWLHGRCWFRRSLGWKNERFSSLNVEWSVPCGHCGWGVTIGGGDCGKDFGFTFAIPLLLTLYVTLDNAFKNSVVKWSVDQGSGRQINCYFHDWTFRYSIWVGAFASWSRSYPWCRWWRQGSIDMKNILGKEHCETTILQDRIPVTVPMPEGNYVGFAKIEQRRWKRALWFPTVRTDYWLEIPKGIPHAGKGENSWDCGDDGLFGIGGSSLENVIARAVESVMTSRRRYGKASDKAMREARA